MSPHSANFQSAVSRVSNPLDLENKLEFPRASTLPTGSLRYERVIANHHDEISLHT